MVMGALGGIASGINAAATTAVQSLWTGDITPLNLESGLNRRDPRPKPTTTPKAPVAPGKPVAPNAPVNPADPEADVKQKQNEIIDKINKVEGQLQDVMKIPNDVVKTLGAQNDVFRQRLNENQVEQRRNTAAAFDSLRTPLGNLRFNIGNLAQTQIETTDKLNNRFDAFGRNLIKQLVRIEDAIRGIRIGGDNNNTRIGGGPGGGGRGRGPSLGMRGAPAILGILGTLLSMPDVVDVPEHERPKPGPEDTRSWLEKLFGDDEAQASAVEEQSRITEQQAPHVEAQNLLSSPADTEEPAAQYSDPFGTTPLPATLSPVRKLDDAFKGSFDALNKAAEDTRNNLNAKLGAVDTSGVEKASQNILAGFLASLTGKLKEGVDGILRFFGIKTDEAKADAPPGLADIPGDKSPLASAAVTAPTSAASATPPAPPPIQSIHRPGVTRQRGQAFPAPSRDANDFVRQEYNDSTQEAQDENTIDRRARFASGTQTVDDIRYEKARQNLATMMGNPVVNIPPGPDGRPIDINTIQPATNTAPTAVAATPPASNWVDPPANLPPAPVTAAPTSAAPVPQAPPAAQIQSRYNPTRTRQRGQPFERPTSNNTFEQSEYRTSIRIAEMEAQADRNDRWKTGTQTAEDIDYERRRQAATQMVTGGAITGIPTGPDGNPININTAQPATPATTTNNTPQPATIPPAPTAPAPAPVAQAAPVATATANNTPPAPSIPPIAPAPVIASAQRPGVTRRRGEPFAAPREGTPEFNNPQAWAEYHSSTQDARVEQSNPVAQAAPVAAANIPQPATQAPARPPLNIQNVQPVLGSVAPNIRVQEEPRRGGLSIRPIISNEISDGPTLAEIGRGIRDDGTPLDRPRAIPPSTPPSIAADGPTSAAAPTVAPVSENEVVVSTHRPGVYRKRGEPFPAPTEAEAASNVWANEEYHSSIDDAQWEQREDRLKSDPRTQRTTNTQTVDGVETTTTSESLNTGTGPVATAAPVIDAQAPNNTPPAPTIPAIPPTPTPNRREPIAAVVNSRRLAAMGAPQRAPQEPRPKREQPSNKRQPLTPPSADIDLTATVTPFGSGSAGGGINTPDAPDASSPGVGNLNTGLTRRPDNARVAEIDRQIQALPPEKREEAKDVLRRSGTSIPNTPENSGPRNYGPIPNNTANPTGTNAVAPTNPPASAATIAPNAAEQLLGIDPNNPTAPAPVAAPATAAPITTPETPTAVPSPTTTPPPAAPNNTQAAPTIPAAPPVPHQPKGFDDTILNRLPPERRAEAKSMLDRIPAETKQEIYSGRADPQQLLGQLEKVPFIGATMKQKAEGLINEAGGVEAVKGALKADREGPVATPSAVSTAATGIDTPTAAPPAPAITPTQPQPQREAIAGVVNSPRLAAQNAPQRNPQPAAVTPVNPPVSAPAQAATAAPTIPAQPAPAANIRSDKITQQYDNQITEATRRGDTRGANDLRTMRDHYATSKGLSTSQEIQAQPTAQAAPTTNAPTPTIPPQPQATAPVQTPAGPMPPSGAPIVVPQTQTGGVTATQTPNILPAQPPGDPRQYKSTDIVGADHPIWKQVHPDLAAHKMGVLGHTGSGSATGNITAGAVQAADAVFRQAETEGVKMKVAEGGGSNRHSANHGAARTGVGESIDVKPVNGWANEKQSYRYAETAAAAGANRLGVSSNNIGLHIQNSKDTGSNLPTMSWNYGKGTDMDFRERLQAGAFNTPERRAQIDALYAPKGAPTAVAGTSPAGTEIPATANNTATPTIPPAPVAQAPAPQPIIYNWDGSRLTPTGSSQTIDSTNYGGRQKPVDYAPSMIPSAVGASAAQYRELREGIAGIESARYNQMGGSAANVAGGRFAGRYQMGGDEIAEAAAALGEVAPVNSVIGAQSGKPVKVANETYLNDGAMQERYFEKSLEIRHNYLMKNSPVYQAQTAEQKLQTLAYAHNQGQGWGNDKIVGATQWLETGKVGQDAFGTAGTKYSKAVAGRLASLSPDQKIATAGTANTMLPILAQGQPIFRSSLPSQGAFLDPNISGVKPEARSVESAAVSGMGQDAATPVANREDRLNSDGPAAETSPVSAENALGTEPTGGGGNTTTTSSTTSPSISADSGISSRNNEGEHSRESRAESAVESQQTNLDESGTKAKTDESKAGAASAEPVKDVTPEDAPEVKNPEVSEGAKPNQGGGSTMAGESGHNLEQDNAMSKGPGIKDIPSSSKSAKAWVMNNSEMV